MLERDHFEKILDLVPSALISIGADMTVLHRNQLAAEIAPMIEPGSDIWECLRPVINEEKIDRMLLRGERVVFRTDPGLPLLEWLISDRHPDDGSRVLVAWDASITDRVVQRRITFVVAASHELRSPLTALLGFAEILELERETLSPSQAEAASVILRNANHLSSLVDDIVDLTKNSFGELRLELEKVEVSPIVRGVIETLRPQIEEKGQILDVQVATDLPPIDADPHRILQIAFNLIQNAHVHSPAGTTIEVRTEQVEYGVQLVVTDDGDGMPFADPEKAFVSFERGVASDNQGNPGSGIGLTITRGMVELHRGLITVKSEAGTGSSFNVWLPLDRDEARRVIFSGEL
ncbi:MAG: HAMP domain-containing histidine kinase [Thermoleophilia bacterium]|nr:HAMP domain-containing histidine kinase [Thermoleophilia bacterium]